VEQADWALSDKARDLRLRLEPDIPCPVCGATDHPIHADVELLALAKTLRENLSAARVSSETAHNHQTAAEGQLASAQAREKQAQAEITAAKLRISKALVDWAEGLATAQYGPYFPALPAHPADTEGLLQDAIGTLKSQQQTAQTAARDMATRGKTLTTTNAHRETLRATIVTRGVERSGLTNGVAELRQAQALAQQGLAGETARIEKLTNRLQPTLAAVQEPMSALIVVPALQSHLATLADRVAHARAMQNTANDQLAALGPQIATAASKARNAADQAKHAFETDAARQTVLTDLHVARAPPLDGEATATHRTRFNLVRKAALDAKEAAKTVFGESMQKSASAKAQYETAQVAEGKANAALKTAAAGLAHALTASGLDTEILATLVKASRDEVEKLRQH